MGSRLYREKVLDHYRNPRREGLLEAPDGEAEGSNTSCGDRVTITLAVDGENIQRIGFEASGCAITVAAASMLAEDVEGEDVAAVREDAVERVTELLGGEVAEQRRDCARLPAQVLQEALEEVVEGS
ncbi:MAG: iron-sulfur cluster assembly scaffold protein [Candidatus Nanohaloarchaea archaeon]|nr:iron-sulfur cluster assembly scaffold protein [Candidatus Nanohaloarchaea archaeon]